MAGDTLVNVKADTAEDFLDKAHKAMGDASKLGDTTYELNLDVKTDSKSGKITKATFTLKTSIKRVHWAGPAKTKPDKNNSDAIQKIESLNRAHEEAHRDGYMKAFKKNQPVLEKQLVGKSEDEAADIVAKMNDALQEACEALHKRGGMIKAKAGSSGSITVTESAEGPGGCS
jgi:hypothetical protein